MEFLASSFRSNHQRCSIQKGVFRNFTKFTGKNLCQGLFFNNVAGLRPATLLKKRLWHRCFPVNFKKFLKTFFIEHLRTTDSWVFNFQINKTTSWLSHVHFSVINQLSLFPFILMNRRAPSFNFYGPLFSLRNSTSFSA